MALRVFKNTTEIKVTCYFVLIEESESATAQTTHPCHTPIVKVHILIVKAVLKMQHVKVFSWKKKIASALLLLPKRILDLQLLQILVEFLCKN